MSLRFRLPMYGVAAALLGLIALLATLQYRWLGQISTAERERMQTSLAARTTAFAQDFDRELTRAYLTFQIELLQEDSLAARVGERYDRWHATSRYPRLVKEIFLASRGEAEPLKRFNPSTRFIEPAEWPDTLSAMRAQLATPDPAPDARGMVVTMLPASLWEDVPALLVPAPMLFVSAGDRLKAPLPSDFTITHRARYTILVLDRDYLSNELLPALAQHHLRGGESTEFQIAVVTAAMKPVFSTSSRFDGSGGNPDASADMFQVRMQEFSGIASEIRRFTSVVSQTRGGAGNAQALASDGATKQVQQFVVPGGAVGSLTVRETPPVSIVLQHSGPAGTAEARRALEAGLSTTTAVRPSLAAARWRVLVKHPSGSLELAVSDARRRNLLVSSGILAVLGVSIGFLVVSTRRAQNLARQQMEFVAAVSHELRTPLAVIRSAADNLAEGVVEEGAQVRQYGELVRGEGRRLSEMVEQILELAGIHSGQRGFVLRPVGVVPLLHDVIRSCDPLVNQAGLQVELDVSETLPAVLGDEQALRRVFQNLLSNAIKYGGSGGWIGVRARASAREVVIAVADRGMGIEPAAQEHIFEPFYRAPGVIAAQIHGAGLGLSLVQRIVEAHGGRITVRSAPGEGSEFIVHLPAASEEPVSRAAASQQELGARS